MKKILFVFVVGLFSIAIVGWSAESEVTDCSKMESDSVTEAVACDPTKQNCQVAEEQSNTNAVSVGGGGKKPKKP